MISSNKQGSATNKAVAKQFSQRDRTGLKIPCGKTAGNLNVRNIFHYIRSLASMLDHDGNTLAIHLSELWLFMVQLLHYKRVMNRILVVDDEPLILYSLAKTLQGDGVEVITFNNGSDAIEASRRSFYNPCLVDLCLPDMDGIDVMMKIRQQSPESKIVILSASCVKDSVKEIIDKNAYLFIPKPFELGYVKAIVRKILKDQITPPHSAAWWVKPADERRGIERNLFQKKIMYRINCLEDKDLPHMDAQIVDISEAGMGIVTSYPVKPGCVIRFDVIKDGINYTAGVVTHTNLVDNNLYRAGIEFV